MKFICSVDINKPISVVSAFFKNPKYLGEYQEGFLRKELISGKENSKGAISKIYYKIGKGEMLLTETILKNELPNSFLAFYHHKHTENTMQTTFISIDENTTRYEAEINYSAFKGYMVKLMKFLFPSMFKKQVQKWLNNFKLFVEKEG